jgi:hypothetical protein
VNGLPPKGKQPWTDAVTMSLTHAITFTTIYDEEVLSDQLILYDWLHLHHEDSNNMGSFGAYRNALLALILKLKIWLKKLKYIKVSEAKIGAVAKKIFVILKLRWLVLCLPCVLQQILCILH